MKRLVLSFLLMCLLLVSFSKAQSLESNTYCVSENRSCNTSLTDSCVECQPLMWFVNRTWNISNDSTVIFISDEHNLNHNITIFHYKNNLTLRGTGKSTITCRGENSGFLFQNSSAIRLINLTFQHCKTKMPNHLYGGVFFKYTNNITLSEVQIRNCGGYGLHVGDSCGNITIESSHFTENKDGNAVFWFKKCEKNLDHIFLNICSSSFHNGTTHTENATGLYLNILRGKVNVTLTKLELQYNQGGNIEIHLVDFAQSTSTITMLDCTIKNGTTTYSGGGLRLWFEKNLTENIEAYNCTSNRQVLTVNNTLFKGNMASRSGAGVAVVYYEQLGMGCTIRKVVFNNCIFADNMAPRGSAIEIAKHKVPAHKVHNAPQFSVILSNCTIENNKLMSNQDQISKEATVEIFSVEDLQIKNSLFTNNNGTALMLVNSEVQFFNETTFSNNSAEYGGAVKLCDSSKMYFNNHTNVSFINNRAHLAGGAIYTGNQCLQQTPPCFFQIAFENPPAIKDVARGLLNFQGNKAKIAGHAIYGGSVDNCFTDAQLGVDNSSLNVSYRHSLKLFWRIFHFSNENQPSLVTSDPYGVCQCNISKNKLPDCTKRNLSISVYPGERQTLKISAVGQTKGIVPAQISIDKVEPETFSLSRYDTYTTESLQSIPLCQQIQIAIMSPPHISNVTIKFGIVRVNSISESSNYYRIPKLTVNIKILHCPLLFALNDRNYCDCEKHLKKNGIHCNITFTTITKPKGTNVWVGYIGPNNSHIGTSRKCQKNRCHQTDLILNVSNLSRVCVKERDGRVCGKCRADYSLSLGPLKCISNDNCSNLQTVTLLVAVFLAGILLFCFLSVLNFTVAEGTVNGLFLYTSCVHANPELLQVNKHLYAFISWLNLDFGFSVCFYSGMTAYQKIWLEIGFLLYLFLLGVLIVFMSRKFIWFTRLTGRNMVPVLSTVILMTYPKLVKNSIKVWFCSNDDSYWSSDNSKPWIWHSDETIDCFTGKHLVLFIVSVLLFLVAFLYTLCLLFIQCLQRRSGWCVLRWVNKLRPFFDANTGLCRDHYQFWPGLLIFVRLLLYVTFWRLEDLDIQPKHKDNMQLIAIITLCIFLFFFACVSPKGVYKKWPLNILEFSFIFNLAVGFGAIYASNELRYAYSNSSVAIALFTLIFILGYHTYRRLKETRKWKRLVIKIKERNRQQRASTTESPPTEEAPLIHNQQIPAVINFNVPREPLLEDD